MQVNVLEYFEKGALKSCPDKTAIIDLDRSYTFAELEVLSKRCAALILAKTQCHNQPMAVYLPKCADTLIADLGIIYSANAYSNLDSKAPDKRLQGVIDNLNAALFITSEKLSGKLVELGVSEKKILLIEEVHSDTVSYNNEAILRRQGLVLDVDPLFIMNTSGSTGTPKSVACTHRGIIDFMDWAFDYMGIDGSVITGTLSAFYFDGYIIEFYSCLHKGATMVLIPEHYVPFPAKLVEHLANHRVNFIFWVPTMMVNIANLELLDKFDLSSLRWINFAGEVLPTKHLNYWRRHIPDARYINLYGPIEISVICTYYEVDREFDDSESLPIGCACANTEILILNDELETAGQGEQGELFVRGSSVGLGYWNDPERTAQAFVQNPLNKNYPETIYRTGDLGYMNEHGEIIFVGRRDFQVKHFGNRVELGEIEHVVANLEYVDKACVLYDNDKKAITIFFEADEAVTPAALRKDLIGVLPKYMIPTVYHRRDELPKNPNGKIDRKKLSDMMEGQKR